MDKKLFDSEIIKALECCTQNTKCPDCPMWNTGQNCMNRLYQYALDLINRQQAENEELTKEVNFLRASKNLDKSEFDKLKIELELKELELKTAKAEAYKEFAERLKTNLNTDISAYGNCTVHYMIGRIDNLLKEMVGDN